MIRMNIYILYDLEIDQNGIGNYRNGYVVHQKGKTMSYVTGEKCLELYEKDIQAAKPLLKTLKKYSRVVWLDQVPLIEADLKIFRDVINEKLLPMNRLARRLLQ